MFGGNKPFGSTTGSSLFGSNTQNKPMFGSTTTNTGGSSLFGQKPATSTGGLFGASTTNQPSSSLFGGSTANNNTSGGLFGGSTQNKSSLFGSTTQPTNTFGTSSGGGLFGSSTTTSGLFGSSTAGNAPNGTVIKFNPAINQDTMMRNGTQQSIQTKNMCITAMKDYEGKSYEELRVDDYIANRKAPTAGTTGGLFGASTSTPTGGGGLFGTTTPQQPKSLFGTTTSTSSPFGGGTQQSTSLFGGGATQQQQQQGSSLFGNKTATGGGLFGGATTTTNTFGTASTGGGLFGGAATSTASPFGATSQPATTFGSTFGQTSQPSGGGLFGGATTTTNTFGAATTGGSLFGNTQQQQTGGGLFGSKPATSGFGGFGSTTSQPATSTAGGLFGSTAAKPGGLFGSTTTPATGGGLFGSTTTQPATGGLFGSTQPAQQGGGLFGQPAQQQQALIVSNPATVEVAAKPIILGSDVNETMLKMAMIEASLATNPYGNSPLLKLASPLDSDEKPCPTSANRQMRFLKKVADTAKQTSPATASPASANSISFLSMNIPVAGSKVRSRAIAVGSDLNYKSTRTPPTLGKGIGGKAPGSANASLRNTTLNGSLVNKTVDSAIERALNTTSNGLPGSARRSHIKHLDLDEIKSVMKSGGRSTAISTTRRDEDELPPISDEITSDHNDSIIVDPREAVLRRQKDINQPIPRLNLDSTTDSIASPVSNVEKENRLPVRQEGEQLAPAGVTLKTSDYFCEPTIRAMTNMVVDGKVVLPDGLTVGRATYGTVFWPGPLELSNIALDEVVIFRHKEVTVYPDESVKPPLGEGLNRPAEVTLERVWHINRETKEEVKDPIILAEIGWRDRLERVTLKMGALFKDYRASTGSWVFKVEHFSKYGLADEDDDEELPPAARIRRMKEQALQSKVQRTAVHHSAKNIEAMEAEERLLVEAEIVLIDGTVTDKLPGRGLGGDEDMASDVEVERWGDQQIPPEKKPKIESNDQVVEESRRLMEILMANQTRSRVEKPMPKCVPATRQFTGGKKASEIKGMGKSLWIDLGSARGSNSRVGWSADGLYVESLQPSCNMVRVRTLNRAYDISEDFITDMLEHNIRLAQVIKRNHSISAKVRHHELDGQQVAPRIKPTNDHAQLIDSFCATAHQSNRLDDERVWKLCKALFPANNEGRWRWDRLENVSEWLREEVARLPLVDAGKGRGAQVWKTLCRGHLEAAIDVAEEEGLFQLAAMLSIFQVDPRGTQQDFVAQVAFWEKTRMLEYVELPLLKIYLLFAGRLSVSFIARGKQVKVSVIDGLNWKQAMGVYLWWLRGFRCFEETIEEAFANVPAPKETDDLLFYHLMKLCRNGAYCIETVLDAAIDFGQGLFDYLLAWHLWTVLRSIGYNTMKPEAEQRLHSGYSEQLIANRLPHLALFVLSFISNDQNRSFAMRECLDRIAMITEKSDFDRMQKIIDLPKTWIASARYIKAKAKDQKSKACEMALLAGDLTTAYRLFANEVAPNAVLSEDMPELIKLLSLFEPVADRIPGWGQQGQLYQDYVDFKNISMTESEEDDDLRVSELMSSMICKLQAPIFETPLQRLCSQTIGQQMYEMQRMLTGTHVFTMPLGMQHMTTALRRAGKVESSEALAQ